MRFALVSVRPSLVRSLAAAMSLAAACAAAHGALIPTLYNTGVDASGAVLPDGTIGDPHYVLASVPTGTSAIRIITAASGYPIPPYLGDNSLSRWIGPNNNSTLTSEGGIYTYRTTFDLTAYDLTTAAIVGSWSTDNNGLDILINGISLGFTTSLTQFATGMAGFSVTSGFVPGLNTLEFVVSNFDDGSPNPTALRVEMVGSADALSVPEPGTLGLAGLWVALATLRGRGRRGDRSPPVWCSRASAYPLHGVNSSPLAASPTSSMLCTLMDTCAAATPRLTRLN